MFKHISLLTMIVIANFNQSFADKVWLQNEDIVSGKIVSLEEGVLLLQSSILGNIIIPWESVTALQTDQSVSILLKTGDRIIAKLNRSASHAVILQSELIQDVPLEKERIQAIGVDSNIQLQNDLHAADAKIEDVSAPISKSSITMDELQTSLSDAAESAKLWKGSVSLLGGFKTGNREAVDLFVKAEGIRETEREKLTLRSDFGYGESEKVVDTTEGRIQSNIRVYFDEDYYVFGDLLLEHDRFEDLELRVDGTVGAGYRFWKTEESELSLDVGAGASQEIFRSGGSETEGIMRISAEYSQLLFGETKLSQLLTVFPSVSELGDLRLISRTSFITPILDSLSWDLSIIDEFDTAPRSNNIDKNDVAVRTGLTYSF